MDIDESRLLSFLIGFWYRGAHERQVRAGSTACAWQENGEKRKSFSLKHRILRTRGSYVPEWVRTPMRKRLSPAESRLLLLLSYIDADTAPQADPKEGAEEAVDDLLDGST